MANSKSTKVKSSKQVKTAGKTAAKAKSLSPEHQLAQDAVNLKAKLDDENLKKKLLKEAMVAIREAIRYREEQEEAERGLHAQMESSTGALLANMPPELVGYSDDPLYRDVRDVLRVRFVLALHLLVLLHMFAACCLSYMLRSRSPFLSLRCVHAQDVTAETDAFFNSGPAPAPAVTRSSTSSTSSTRPTATPTTAPTPNFSYH